MELDETDFEHYCFTSSFSDDDFENILASVDIGRYTNSKVHRKITYLFILIFFHFFLFSFFQIDFFMNLFSVVLCQSEVLCGMSCISDISIFFYFTTYVSFNFLSKEGHVLFLCLHMKLSLQSPYGDDYENGEVNNMLTI